MNGLEIIEYIAIEQIPDSVLIGLILSAFSILIPTLVVYHLTKDDIKALIAEAISGIIYIMFFAGALTSGVFDKPTGEYQYKVKITEDVSYVEFTDKYDVVTENDDGTYIIQVKKHIKE